MWDHEIGWEYIQEIQKAGREVDPGDFPPKLQWEAPLWQLYERFSGQWRAGMGGRYGYDYAPAIELIRERGWDIDRCTELLHVIEVEILRQDRVEREQQNGRH